MFILVILAFSTFFLCCSQAHLLGRIVAFLSDPLTRGSRSVRPSSTYHPRTTNSVEVDTRAELESTVILSRLSLEVVVCELEKWSGYGSELGQRSFFFSKRIFFIDGRV